LVQRSVVEQRLIWIDDSPSLLLLALAKGKKKDSPHLVDCMACRLQARPTGIITRTREEVSNSRTTRIRIKTCMNKSLKVTCSINQSAAALSKKKKKNWDVQ
jgi:hypothetical protein